jgi:glycerol uptake facilitator-like aquaporin
MYDLWKSLITEFLGTFILTFIGAGAVALTIANGGSVVGSALAFGLAYLFLIYTFGCYSGANFNPAISFGLALTGRLGWCRMFLYWIMQFLGAIAAAALISWIYGIDGSAGAPGGDLTFEEPWKVVVLEMFLTFFLVLTFLFMTRNPYTAIISGFVIGLTLTADILVGGFIARVGVNPAYALGTSIFANTLNVYWIFVLGPLLGALLAALIYKAFTIPWTCSEIEAKGCDYNCGELPFYEEWKECDPAFMASGKRQYEMAGGMEEMKCGASVCDILPKCDMMSSCDKPCATGGRGKKSYRYVPL